MGPEHPQILVFEGRGNRTSASQTPRDDCIAILLKLTRIESVLLATKENQQIQGICREYESKLKSIYFLKKYFKTMY